MKLIFARLFFAAAVAFAAVPSIGWAKTVRECEAEWKANKAAIQASGLIHSDDSQIGRSSPSSHYESRNCRQRHASRSPPA